MRFVVDGMLGKLARWLRMLGYQTEYDSNMDDNGLLLLSGEKDAILLTRDEELQTRATVNGIKSLLILGKTEQARLAQLAKQLGISLNVDMARTRCTKCGYMLREISREEASHTVPVASLNLHEQFWKCTAVDCGKTYWVGSHWQRIRQTLAEAQDMAERQ